jgi:hypothetical protein
MRPILEGYSRVKITALETIECLLQDHRVVEREQRRHESGESWFVAVHPGFEIGWHATAKRNVFWSRLKVSQARTAKSRSNGDKGIQKSAGKIRKTLKSLESMVVDCGL